jgi:prophage regulatory protein
MEDAMTNPLRFMRLPAVAERVGLSRSQVYRLAARGQFPRPIRVGSAAVWPSDEIENWMRKQLDRAGRPLVA